MMKAVVYGDPIDPDTPRVVGRFDFEGQTGVRLCGECARGIRASADDFAIPSSVREPCCLCKGSTVLYDDGERPFACPCTPAGRWLANGIPDEEVARRFAAE